MKNLFRLSDFYIVLIAFVLVLASCSRRDLYHSIGNDKLEKLSTEIENSTASASTVSSPEAKDLIAEEQNIQAVPGKIYSSGTEGIKSKVNSRNASKSMKETRQELKQQLKDGISNNKTKLKRGGLSQRMKLGIILAAVGLLIAVLLGWPLYFIGVVLFIIGAVLIIMELINY
jgi:Flp pilus assembly protein TadB